jgi:putative alpha-1,2-mannosidase
MNFVLLTAMAAALGVQGPSAYDAVDPFIGTGGEGHTFPGAVAPFGMVQLSPDTNTSCAIRDCYKWAAGYRYEDSAITGFSMTHFSGAGTAIWVTSSSCPQSVPTPRSISSPANRARAIARVSRMTAKPPRPAITRSA